MPDMRDVPGHLPNLRAGGEPPRPDWLPRQRDGNEPQMIGRFPDYDVLESASDWDEATREVVLARLELSSRAELLLRASRRLRCAPSATSCWRRT